MRGCLVDLMSWMLPHQSSVHVIGHTPVGTSFLAQRPSSAKKAHVNGVSAGNKKKKGTNAAELSQVAKIRGAC